MPTGNVMILFKERISDDELIAVGHGRVDFVTPHLRDYLREEGELNPR